MDDGRRPRSDGGNRVGRPRSIDLRQVVAAAIELADDQGINGLTMPKLARRLGVGTMTLYGYVENKQALLDEMAASIFEGLTVPAEGDWRTMLTTFFGDFRAAAIAHPALASLLADGRITIPAVFDTLETCIGRMTAGGLSVESAARTFYAALAYTVGFVIWEIPRTHLQHESRYAEQWQGLLEARDPAEYPLLTGPASEVLATVASVMQFEWGLQRVLA